MFHQKLGEADGVDGDVYAAEYVPTLRSWSDSTFVGGLRGENFEKREIVDQLFANYAQRVAQDPTRHRMDYVHGYAVFAASN